jgi:hypothetical protein
MQKARTVVYQSAYVCTLKPSKAQSTHISALKRYIGLALHEGLTGILMRGEDAILGLVEGSQDKVQDFIANAHPAPVWMSRHVMTHAASATRLYPGLDLRLRYPCAMPELMAFAADLRRCSKNDVIWHVDNITLAQWLEPSNSGTVKAIKHAF